MGNQVWGVVQQSAASDFWSRTWPSEKMEKGSLTNTVCSITLEGGDFKLRSEDRRDLSERKEKCGLVCQVSDTHAEVKTEDAQRMCVPARSRRSLLCSLHFPDHQGEHTLVRRLQPHCTPNKQEHVREFLKHCTCCTSEPQMLLRRESPKSKQQSVIQADKHLDVAQLDVCSRGDQNCLTFADVKTKRVWVRKLLKKGAAKKNKGAHKRKVLEQHVIWESSLGQVPKQLRMDNEDASIAVPHKNIRAHPAHRPQNNGIMERAHQEVARLCRSMNSTPDEVCKCLRVNLEPLQPALEAGGGEEHKVKCGLASKQAQPSANIATASAHDGGTLEPGSLVLVKVHSRSRKKSDPAWVGPFEAQSRASTKSHFLKRNDRLSHRHIDDVKPFSLADETFKDSKVNPVVFEKGKSHSGKMPKSFDVKHENLNADCSGDWKGETVWLGRPGGEELERVVSKLKLRGFKSAVLVVPEVPFRDWCATLEGIRNARWHGVEPGDEHQFWVDSSGRPHCKPPVAWWVVRIAGKGKQQQQAQSFSWTSCNPNVLPHGCSSASRTSILEAQFGHQTSVWMQLWSSDISSDVALVIGADAIHREPVLRGCGQHSAVGTMWQRQSSDGMSWSLSQGTMSRLAPLRQHITLTRADSRSFSKASGNNSEHQFARQMLSMRKHVTEVKS
eukprot:jgi/Bigna1/70820/fgenesh1_pg.13_\